MKKICMFPGQGSQKIGMGKSFYDNFKTAKEVFEEADSVLNKNLTDIIFNDEQALKNTVNSQPALMVVSYAIFSVLKQEFGVKVSDFSYGIGHSLGEYSALTVAEALSFKDALLLLKTRSEAMESSVPNKAGGMIACIGISISDLKKLELGKVEIANDNSEMQVVLSGMQDDLKLASEILLKNGAKKVIPLDVSGPFHSSYMTHAYNVLSKALLSTNVHQPIIPIISNVTAKPVTNPNEIKTLLAEQINHGVKWRESVESFTDLGIECAIEIGSGKVLSGLVKRINKNVNVYNIETIEDLKNLKELNII